MPNKTEKASIRIKSLIRSAGLVNSAILERERDLSTSKWVDYRFMSPLEATLLFASEYEKAYQSAAKKHVDANGAHKAIGLNRRAIKRRSTEMTQLWIARQHADSVGLPYNLYLEFCFEFAMRRMRRRLPRPSQLFWSSRTETAWKAKFDEYHSDLIAGGMLRPASLPQYRIEAYRGLHSQDDFRELVIALTKGANRVLDIAVENYSIRTRQVPIRLFSAVYGRYALLRAVRSLKNRRDTLVTEPRVPIDSIDLWQSCFGAPSARNPLASPCVTCPVNENCRKVSDLVAQQIRKMHGTETPVDSLVKERARIRQRKSRAKRKAETTVSCEATSSIAAESPC